MMLTHHAFICRVPTLSLDVVKEVRNSFLPGLETDYISIDAFGIDDVRTLTEKAFVKPREGKTLLLVVSLKSITVEAQQALLKILEEPPSSTAFLFVVPESLHLLPTTLSRFLKHSFTSGVQGSAQFAEYEEFKKLSPSERIVLIGTKTTAKDNSWIEAIKLGLQQELTQSFKVQTMKQVATLYFVAEHLQTRGAGNKMLLEELAFSL